MISNNLLELAKFHTIVTDKSLNYDVKIIVRSTIILSKKVAHCTKTGGFSPMLLQKEKVHYAKI